MAALGEDLSEEDIENMVKEADKDGDNRIDFNGEIFPNLSSQINPDNLTDLTKKPNLLTPVLRTNFEQSITIIDYLCSNAFIITLILVASKSVTNLMKLQQFTPKG